MKLETIRLMFSSLSQKWQTPREVYDQLDEEFHFTIDPCPPGDPTFDGLSIPWNGCAFVNPPFGHELPKWIRKRWEESRRGTTVVFLIPARTDTRWFHDYCVKGEIRFIKGRLRFKNPNEPEWEPKSSAPFPSMIVIFRPDRRPAGQIKLDGF